jgi:hypothetical protein
MWFSRRNTPTDPRGLQSGNWGDVDVAADYTDLFPRQRRVSSVLDPQKRSIENGEARRGRSCEIGGALFASVREWLKKSTPALRPLL